MEVKVGSRVVQDTTLIRNLRMVAGRELGKLGSGKYGDLLSGMKEDLRGNGDIAPYLADALVISSKNELGLPCCTKSGNMAMRMLGVRADMGTPDEAEGIIGKILGTGDDVGKDAKGGEGAEAPIEGAEDLRKRMLWDMANYDSIREYEKVSGKRLQRVNCDVGVLKKVLPEAKEGYLKWLQGIAVGEAGEQGMTNVYDLLMQDVQGYLNSIPDSVDAEMYLGVISSQLGILKFGIGDGLKRYGSVGELLDSDDFEAFLTLYKGVM